MLTLFSASTIPTSQMDDDALGKHISLLLLQLDSLLIEMKDSWNKPHRASLNEAIRTQLNELAAQLTAAQSVYEFRLNSMR